MKKVLLALVVIVLAIGVYCFVSKKKGPAAPAVADDQPIKIGGHSAAFNSSVDSLLSNYFELADAFVNADSAKALAVASKLSASIPAIPLDELKKDSSENAEAIYSTDSMSLAEMKTAIDQLIAEKTLEPMRHAFATISENLYPFLKGINYGQKKLYWYNCGMPFGENTSANWISATDEPFNPFLGKHHAEYKSAMLHCGEVQDSFVVK